MRANKKIALSLVKEIDSEAADWLPAPVLEHTVNSVIAGTDPKSVIADAQTLDPDNAAFISLEFLTQVVAIALAIQTTWEFVGFIDKVLEVALDHNEKLKIVERVIERLKQAGLEYPAARIQAWVDRILERLTRPPNP